MNVVRHICITIRYFQPTIIFLGGEGGSYKVTAFHIENLSSGEKSFVVSVASQQPHTVSDLMDHEICAAICVSTSG